jgi:hypothetical protein
MSIQEAKLILQFYRPGGEDDADPFFAEALELARTDGELGEWFAGQQVFDASVARALQTEIPPADLRASIIARKSSLPEASPGKKPLSLFWWVAMTASIMLLGGIAMFLAGPNLPSQGDEGNPTMTVASFTRQALDIKEQGRISLGMQSTDPAQLRTWLAERGAPAGFVIPPGLKGIPSLGCQSYTMGATKVSLVCFSLGNNKIAHLFIVDKSALSDASNQSQPDLRAENGLAFATWTSGGKSYVLTGDNVSMEMLKKLV